MTTHLASHIVSRRMAHDDDFRRMRQLLVDTVPITPIGFNWDMRRLDGKRFYNADLEANRLLARPVQLWEDDGALVAYVLSEGVGDAHLQVHPDYRHLEDEMIEWAEAHLAAPDNDGLRQMELVVNEYDAHRQRLLTERGFEKMDYGGMIRHLRFGRQPIPEPQVADGYTLRITRPEEMDDCRRIADLLNAAFRRDFHNGEEYQNFTRHAPSFVGDLDLAMEAPDGSFAAYVGIPYDLANRRGVFEPVCTHPDHQRKGLARALMLEGLHRLRLRGAVDVIVDTGDMVPANALYSAMGFTEAYRGFVWKKLYT
ncbi:MAG: GNAT family N-acetyltransferase [Caldilineaceae bacterium]|nr:GNAT family N-acetyltransferase [Caldilineaceae bacterium]